MSWLIGRSEAARPALSSTPHACWVPAHRSPCTAKPLLCVTTLHVLLGWPAHADVPLWVTPLGPGFLFAFLSSVTALVVTKSHLLAMSSLIALLIFIVTSISIQSLCERSVYLVLGHLFITHCHRGY